MQRIQARAQTVRTGRPPRPSGPGQPRRGPPAAAPLCIGRCAEPVGSQPVWVIPCISRILKQSAPPPSQRWVFGGGDAPSLRCRGCCHSPRSPPRPARSRSPPGRRCQSPSSSPRRGALPWDSQLLSILRLLFASDNCSLFLTHPQPPPPHTPPCPHLAPFSCLPANLTTLVLGISTQITLLSTYKHGPGCAALPGRGVPPAQPSSPAPTPAPAGGSFCCGTRQEKTSRIQNPRSARLPRASAQVREHTPHLLWGAASASGRDDTAGFGE